jgi:hypothetical protein
MAFAFIINHLDDRPIEFLYSFPEKNFEVNAADVFFGNPGESKTQSLFVSIRLIEG